MVTQPNTPEQQSALDVVTAIFASYGLQTLTPTIINLVQTGATVDTITMALRDTPEYAARFPAMKALNAAKRGFNEAQYIQYETVAAQTEAQYGLPSGFLTDAHRIEQLLVNNVSASQLQSRAQINAAAAINAPQETRDALRDLYGIDKGALTAFYFDPDNSEPYLQKVTAAATLAGAADRQQIELDRATAERLSALGLSDQAVNSAFGTVANLGSLTGGIGEVVDQASLVDAAFGDAAAQRKVQRVVGGRVAQFQQTQGAAAAQGGIVGLGQSSTR
jgi:hypothetical protein